ncbi:hypothetical protein B0A52_03331 [Exophiala mesophila]|uniref:Protein BIG1 n=1 Tax=Exophiala mesophila TaxID=212818 RepID=A0A438NB26_EXOME|nr:hypothetical protein B0A52_03331 [Exophiala mesophila]
MKSSSTISLSSAFLLLPQIAFLVSATEPATSPPLTPYISTLLPPSTPALNLESWRSQLQLDASPLRPRIHWIYLSGRLECNGTVNVCESFDEAFAKGYHVLESQQQSLPNNYGNGQSNDAINQPPISISYVDCDAEPILCHSWLLKPPAIMHITVTPRTGEGDKTDIPILMRPIRLAPSNRSKVVGENEGVGDNKDDELYSSMTPMRAQQRLIPIINGARPITSFHPWDGLMNPFTGKLGKLGLNTKWGWLTHHYGWLPITRQSFFMCLLALARLAIWLWGPKPKQQAGTSLADRIVRPGALGHPSDGDLPLDQGSGEGDGLDTENGNQMGTDEHEGKKDR